MGFANKVFYLFLTIASVLALTTSPSWAEINAEQDYTLINSDLTKRLLELSKSAVCDSQTKALCENIETAKDSSVVKSLEELYAKRRPQLIDALNRSGYAPVAKLMFKQMLYQILAPDQIARQAAKYNELRDEAYVVEGKISAYDNMLVNGRTKTGAVGNLFEDIKRQKKNAQERLETLKKEQAQIAASLESKGYKRTYVMELRDNKPDEAELKTVSIKILTDLAQSL